MKTFFLSLLIIIICVFWFAKERIVNGSFENSFSKVWELEKNQKGLVCEGVLFNSLQGIGGSIEGNQGIMLFKESLSNFKQGLTGEKNTIIEELYFGGYDYMIIEWYEKMFGELNYSVNIKLKDIKYFEIGSYKGEILKMEGNKLIMKDGKQFFIGEKGNNVLLSDGKQTKEFSPETVGGKNILKVLNKGYSTKCYAKSNL